MIETDSFTADASGADDAYTVPEKARGAARVRIKPPNGHAWTMRAPSISSPAHPYAMDEVADLPCKAVPGDTLGFFALDTGSGTFSVIWYLRELA